MVKLYHKNKLLTKKSSTYFEEQTTKLALLRIKEHDLWKQLKEIKSQISMITAKMEYAALQNKNSAEAETYFALAQQYIDQQ